MKLHQGVVVPTSFWWEKWLSLDAIPVKDWGTIQMVSHTVGTRAYNGLVIIGTTVTHQYVQKTMAYSTNFVENLEILTINFLFWSKFTQFPGRVHEYVMK